MGDAEGPPESSGVRARGLVVESASLLVLADKHSINE